MAALRFMLCASVLMAACLIVLAQDNPFLGKWDITGVGPHSSFVYWLEVKLEDGKLTGYFLNRTGSVLKVADIKLENDELVFTPAGSRPGAPPLPSHHAHLNEDKDKLLGMVTVGGEDIAWLGVPAPKWGEANANKKLKLGTPVALFDGKHLANWEGQHKDKEMGWNIVDGAMTNEPQANNLVSRHRFQDFKIHCEYKVEKNSNSGIYLRGRYELQVLDDFGKPPESHSHMALYSRVAPKVNASKPVGEWQIMEATIVGNRLTVILNGQKVQDNIVIDGITGGALDSNETEPGPIMIQGDHEKITYRRVIVTPILN
ncbi:MAG: DUF1080 domain-containing protein [Acidobacteria bacterium]|nr:DUF1080 domain-containing protein [Acidobacteriota bacterium]